MIHRSGQHCAMAVSSLTVIGNSLRIKGNNSLVKA